MSILRNKNCGTRLTGGALFVSGYLSSDATCANEVSAQHSTAQHSTAQHSTAQHSTAVESASSGGSVKELAFSFYDCTPAPQGPHFTVSSDVSDWSDSAAGYTILRDFCGWITVAAAWFRRKVAVLFRRFLQVKMSRRARVLAYAGGLRL